MTPVDNFLYYWTAIMVFIGCLCVTGAYQLGRYERFLIGRQEAEEDQ